MLLMNMEKANKYEWHGGQQGLCIQSQRSLHCRGPICIKSKGIMRKRTCYLDIFCRKNYKVMIINLLYPRTKKRPICQNDERRTIVSDNIGQSAKGHISLRNLWARRRSLDFQNVRKKCLKSLLCFLAFFFQNKMLMICIES